MPKRRIEPVPVVFVIGPIGDRLAKPRTAARRTYEQAIQVLEEVIEPACLSHGLRPVRADQITKAGEIPEQVFKLLGSADLVIADLTGANPNVMYELGIRHAMGLPSLQIGEHGKLPFDISTIRTVQFTRSENGLVQARRQLGSMLATGLKEGFDQVGASRVLVGHRSPTGEAPPSGDAEEALGFLELIAQMEDAAPRLTARLGEMGSVLNEIGNIAKADAEPIRTAPTFRDRLSLVRQFAERLDDPAKRLEDLAAAYENEMAYVDRGISYIVGMVEEDPRLLAEAGDLPQSIAGLAVAATEGLGSLESLGRTIESLGTAERSLKVRTNRISGALSRVISSSAPIFEWDRRLRHLKDQEPRRVATAKPRRGRNTQRSRSQPRT